MRAGFLLKPRVGGGAGGFSRYLPKERREKSPPCTGPPALAFDFKSGTLKRMTKVGELPGDRIARPVALARHP